MQIADLHKHWLFGHPTVCFRGDMMIKFALLTLISFGIGLAAIPEIWLTRESATQDEPIVQAEPEVTILTTVENGQSIMAISVVGETRVQFPLKESSARMDNTQVNHPDLSDKHVL